MNRPLALRLSFLCLLLACCVACSRDPNVRKQKYFESGQRYAAEGKYREAAIQYANALQIDSRFVPAHYELGQTYLKLGDGARAFQEFARTVDLDANSYAARTQLANMLLAVRNPDGSPRQDALTQAKTHLDFLRQKQPNRAETHEAWSNYYAAQNNLGPALDEIQQTIALDPGRNQSYLELGLLQLRSNLADQAEASFKKAIAVDPKAMGAQLALGGFYQSRNRLPEADAQFRHAIDVDPKDPAPRAALARLWMLEGRKDDIAALLSRTKKEIPGNSEAYRMLGDFYFANGELDKATAEYGSLSNDHPRDLRVKKNYIQLLILKNRLDEAARLNQEILKSSPRDVDALIYKGQIALRHNDAPAAIDAMERALENDPDNAVGHYQLGLAFAQQQNPTRAETEWREAVRLRPDLSDAQRALAGVDLQRGDVSGLLEVASRIIQAQPTAPDGFLFRSIAEISRQKYTEAEQDAEQALHWAPQSPAPYVQLGNLQLVQKHYAEAEKQFQQALEKDPSYSDGLSGLMNTYIAQQQYDKAVAAANVQIAKSPNVSNFYDLLGTALFNGRKDLAGAEAALRKAIELDPNNTDAIEKLGKVEIQRGGADQALALFELSIKDHPREPRFYILAGELFEQKQNWNQAKTMYQQALNLQPDQPLASNNLAYVMLEQGGNIDVALAMAQTARRAMPNWPNAADTLGWAYYRKGIYQSAISQFQEALKLGEKGGAPDDAVVHYHLGMAYQKSNQNGLARQQLERALKLSPNNSEAKKALSQLRG